MKEASAAAEMQQSTTTSTRSGMATRSAQDKEKTKMRERHRRSITTKIFNGLRKHGGYRLSPRADINEVLRQLTSEAGWTVEPDGTTYRGGGSKKINVCATCGSTGMIGSGTPTPSSSLVGGVPGGGECSTTTSPRRVAGGDSHSMLPYTGLPNSLYYTTGGGISSSFGGGVPATVTLAAYQQQHHQQFYLQESRASNQNTPVGSPQRRG